MRLTAFIFLGALIPALSQGQTTVSSDIVGFQRTTVPVGLSAIGFPMLNTNLVRTVATSFVSNNLALAGENNVGSKLNSGEPFYIEVLSGSLKGDRFDVNTAATISAATNLVVLNPASPNNTFPVASIGTNLNSQTIALRKHVTIAQIGQSASPSLVGNNTATSADQIQLFSPSNRTFINYFLRGDGVTWRLVGTTTSANNVPVPPGVGVFILKRSNSTSLTMTGVVRTNDFAMPLQAGLQLVAPAYPISFSPQSLGASASNGWTGNNTATSADQIQIYNPSTRAFDAYFLRGDGTTWRRVGTTTTVTLSNLIASDSGFYLLRRAANPDGIILNPISP